MRTYRVIPMATELADEARRTLAAPQYGHPAHAEIATDRAPCRVCLRRFDEGVDKRLLFTYDPFESLGAVPLPGPVYIHADPCPPYDGAGFPRELADSPILLDAYGEDRRLLAEDVLGRVDSPAVIDEAIARHLSDHAVRYVHVRSSTAGCFTATITR